MRDEEYRKHGVWNAIAQLDNSHSSFSQQGKESVRFADLKRRIDYLRWVLEQSEPALLTMTELTQVANDLNALPQYLASDAANWQHLATIENQFSSVFSRFPYPRIQKIFRSDANAIIEELSRKVDEVRNSSKSLIDDLKVKYTSMLESVAEFNESATSIRTEIEAQQKQYSAKILTLDAEIGAETTEKIAEITTRYAEFQSEKTGELRELTDSFLTDVSIAKNKLSSSLEEISTERKTLNQEHSELRRELQTKGKQILEKIEAMYSQAGQTALAGGFVDAANVERDLYRSNSLFARGLFLLSAVVLAINWFMLVNRGNNELRELLMRLPISLVLFVPAIYFSTLAAKHRRTAVALQSLGLRIKAFDAYLVGAKETDRQKLRTEMASVFFDSERIIGTAGTVTEPVLGKFFDRIGGIVEKAVEKLPPKSE